MTRKTHRIDSILALNVIESERASEWEFVDNECEQQLQNTSDLVRSCEEICLMSSHDNPQKFETATSSKTEIQAVSARDSEAEGRKEIQVLFILR